jgi:hypothetical protein
VLRNGALNITADRGQFAALDFPISLLIRQIACCATKRSRGPASSSAWIPQESRVLLYVSYGVSVQLSHCTWYAFEPCADVAVSWHGTHHDGGPHNGDRERLVVELGDGQLRQHLGERVCVHMAALPQVLLRLCARVDTLSAMLH